MAKLTGHLRWRFAWNASACVGLAMALVICVGVTPRTMAVEVAAVPCSAKTPQRLVAQVLRKVPHDPTAFTQGLDVAGGILYESDGQYTESAVRSMNATTGVELSRRAVAPQYFAEGLTVSNGRLIQLTWNEQTALVRRPTTLAQSGSFAYSGEGWGLATLSPSKLIMSDGSASLSERDATSFAQTKTWSVIRKGGLANRLNELDFDGANIWANRWLSDEVLRIDPRCHTVTGVLDVAPLRRQADAIAIRQGRQIDVPNGIAHIPGTSKFWLTGKYWPVMFEVKIIPSAG